MSINSIPQLDISRFDTDRDNFVAEFGNAYQEIGFSGIRRHDIDAGVIKSALGSAEAFFALTEVEKRQYISPEGGGRGYIPFGVEKAKDAEHSDLKEFYHLGREVEGVEHLPISAEEFLQQRLNETCHC